MPTDCSVEEEEEGVDNEKDNAAATHPANTRAVPSSTARHASLESESDR